MIRKIYWTNGNKVAQIFLERPIVTDDDIEEFKRDLKTEIDKLSESERDAGPVQQSDALQLY
jgi:hypothetical protein